MAYPYDDRFYNQNDDDVSEDGYADEDEDDEEERLLDESEDEADAESDL